LEFGVWGLFGGWGLGVWGQGYRAGERETTGYEPFEIDGAGGAIGSLGIQSRVG